MRNRRTSTSTALLATAALAFSLACASASPPPPAPAPSVTPSPATAAPAAALVVSDGQALAFAAGKVVPVDPGSADYEVFPDRSRQAVVGFGGAFNEKGWEVLGVLSEADRAQVLDHMFKPGEGLSLGLCRIPIGASDYALSRYSLDDGPEDLKLTRFSIARDRQALIPFIKAAQARLPKMRFWGSAWSPPPWMKTNGKYDSGSMRDEPAVYAAYAEYLARFVEEYGKEGIPVEAVAVQNEPEILTDYPSCQWDPEQYVTFVRDHLGPTLKQRASPAKVMLGTFNEMRDMPHAMAVLRDPAARGYVGILGLQWDGLPIADLARKAIPGLPIWHTETDCGNHHWEPGFDPDKPQNDFKYALLTWRKMRLYLSGGAEVYTLWNVVLDEAGKSIDAKRPWPQNSPIVVDRAAKKAVYTPMYYAFASFSRYAGAGAVVLEGKGTDDALGFRRPDGKLAVVLANPGDRPRTLKVKVGERGFAAELPARAFGTLLVEP
jgi:glucosylceramidase